MSLHKDTTWRWQCEHCKEFSDVVHSLERPERPGGAWLYIPGVGDFCPRCAELIRIGMNAAVEEDKRDL